jgi:hypothetical protein
LKKEIPPAQQFLEIRDHAFKGRAVFSCLNLPRDLLLERVPVIVISEEDWRILEKTVLHNYAFNWGPGQDQAAIALGYGSLFNHSFEPNAYYRKFFDEQMIEFITLRPIQAGEEITINYSGHPFAKEPMWFKVEK